MKPAAVDDSTFTQAAPVASVASPQPSPPPPPSPSRQRPHSAAHPGPPRPQRDRSARARNDRPNEQQDPNSDRIPGRSRIWRPRFDGHLTAAPQSPSSALLPPSTVASPASASPDRRSGGNRVDAGLRPEPHERVHIRLVDPQVVPAVHADPLSTVRLLSPSFAGDGPQPALSSPNAEQTRRRPRKQTQTARAKLTQNSTAAEGQQTGVDIRVAPSSSASPPASSRPHPADPAVSFCSQSVPSPSTGGSIHHHHRPFVRVSHYPPHLPLADLQSGLRSGLLSAGLLRVVGKNAFVSLTGDRGDVYIEGRKARNRAFDGDLVAITIIPNNDSDAANLVPTAASPQDGELCPANLRAAHPITSPSSPSSEEDEEIVVVPAVESDGEGEQGLQQKGLVVGILRSQHSEQVAGRVQTAMGAHLAMFVPLERKHPYAVLPRRQWPDEFVRQISRTKRQTQLNDEVEDRDEKGDKGSRDEDGGETISDTHASHTVYLASYREWRETDLHPRCDLIRALGKTGVLETEQDAVLYQCNIDYDHHGRFPQAVLDEVAVYEKDWRIPQSERERRRDLRPLFVFSIDPTTARDLDDALSIEVLSGSRYRIGVHIADVSHFVRPGTQLDAEAERRATTVYLVDRAIPMLPPILSEQLCSLNAGQERLAFSVFFVMTEEGEVEGEDEDWMGRTIIENKCRLDYHTCQLLIDCQQQRIRSGRGDEEVRDEEMSDGLRAAMAACRPESPHSVTDLLRCCHLLNTIAQRRRTLRFQRGSLTLNNVRLSFRLDASGQPESFYTYPALDSNRLVEEYMLLANRLAAQTLVRWLCSRSLLRHHPPPNARAIAEVSRRCRQLGFPLDVSDSGTIQTQLTAYENRTVGDRQMPARYVLEPICTKPMQTASYVCSAGGMDGTNEWRDGDGRLKFCRAWHHYALAFDHYTHFTSPIRRYADVVVHRLLSQALLTSQQGPHAVDSEGLTADVVTSIASHCNMRKANAKKAQDGSSRLFFIAFLHRHHKREVLTMDDLRAFTAEESGREADHERPAMLEEGVIVRMEGDHFDVIVPRLGLETRMRVKEMVGVKRAFISPPQQQGGRGAGGRNHRAHRPGRKERAEMKAGMDEGLDGSVDGEGETKDRQKEERPQRAVSALEKRLCIEWLDGLRSDLSIFDGVTVQLIAQLKPYMDLLQFVVHPRWPVHPVDRTVIPAVDL